MRFACILIVKIVSAVRSDVDFEQRILGMIGAKVLMRENLGTLGRVA